MKKFINYFKDDITKVSVFSALTIGIVSFIAFVVGVTYAAKPYTIVFNQYEDTRVLKTCYTDENGKLDEDCISTISAICERWSLESKITSGGHTQTNQIYSTDFANMTFTENKNYYCVSKSSFGGYKVGCYVCKDDETIIKWKSNSKSDSECSSGYKFDQSKTDLGEASCAVNSCYYCSDNSNIMEWRNNGIGDTKCPNGYFPIDKSQSECKIIESCYECKDNKNFMKWDNNGNADVNCSSGYVANNKTKNECKPIDPKACYECKDDKNLMEWRNNGEADNKCSSGYVTNNKSESECKPIVPKTCYVCNGNSNLMKWDDNGKGDSNCPLGYTAENISQAQCKPKQEVTENPPTGNILMFIVWVIGLGAICYSVYYYKNFKFNN